MAYDKVIDSAQLDADLTSVADAIRAKGGTSESMEFPDGFVTAVEGIQAGGDTSTEDGLVTGDTKSYVNDRVTTVGSTMFYYNSTLTSIELPNVTTINHSAFRDATKAEKIYIPKVAVLTQSSLRNTKALTWFDSTHLEAISNYALQSSAIKILILRNAEKVCSMSEVAAFNGTVFASGNTGGVLLIPSALVESYQTATNWATLYAYGTNRFLALEDYTVDGTTTGDIDWDAVNALFEEASA